MLRRFIFPAMAAGLLASACATTPQCRPATEAERQLFGAIVAHDEATVASAMAPSASATAARLRNLDPALEAQVFGSRMGDRSVRTVLMRPPLCLYDAADGRNARTTYVFASGRFDALQAASPSQLALGTPGVDHAACRFVEVDGVWHLEDACLSTFSATASSS